MERRDYILRILRDTHKVSVEELCKDLYVSRITIRRDLKQLEKDGLLSRVHGGAVLPFGKTGTKKTINEKEKLNLSEKKRIAKKIATLIADDSTIFCNGGSTTVACIEALQNTNVTIFTNNAVMLSLEQKEGIDIQFLGGKFNSMTQAFYGDIALKSLSNINADYCIMGANGVSIKGGVVSFSFPESHINTLMMQHTIGKKILVVDHTKINAPSNFKICDIEDLDIIVTVKECPPEFVQEIEKLGIEIHLV